MLDGVPTSSGKRLVAVGLIVLMALGSLMLWIGIPVGWLYVVSHLQRSTQPSMGPYVLVLVGIIASMIVMAKLLSRLNRAYSRVTGTDGSVRVQLPWLRSMRGERSSGRPTSVLDVVMIATVLVAATAFGLWFFLLAGAPF
jgi:hypothetical protein